MVIFVMNSSDSAKFSVINTLVAINCVVAIQSGLAAVARFASVETIFSCYTGALV